MVGELSEHTKKKCSKISMGADEYHECRKAQRRVTNNVWRRTHPADPVYRKKTKALRRARFREIINEYKGNRCVLCGFEGPSCAIHLHHIDSSIKEFTLSQAYHNVYREERLRAELEKTQPWCANCHVAHHNCPEEFDEMRNRQDTGDNGSSGLDSLPEEAR